MNHRYFPIPLSLLLPLLTGCTRDVPEVQPLTGYQPDFRRGMYTYNAYCGKCHDTGEGGAPTLDDAEEWEERGVIWPALLQEHVRDGFLAMPAMAKGERRLSEQNIADAIYYMTVKIQAAQ